MPRVVRTQAARRFRLSRLKLGANQVVGYAPDNHVRYITALAKTQGKFLSCKPLGDIKKVQVAGTAGNYVYTHSWKEHEDEFVASARSEAGYFTSCSVKKVGVGIENEEEEHEGRKPT